MDDAWEDWIRPVLLIATALLAGVAWYLEWIPDDVFGVTLGVGVALGAAAVVGVKVAQRATSDLARWVGLAAIAGSLALAGWSPWRLLGPGAEIARGDIDRDGGHLALEALADGPTDYRVYLHGEPRFGKVEADVRLALWAHPGAPHVVRFGRVDTRQSGQGRAARRVEHHDLTWTVRADLSQGGRVEVNEVSERQLSWPVQVELRRSPAPVAPAIGLGALLLALGLLVERRTHRAQRTWLSTLTVAAPVFTVLFGLWFAPGHLTKAMFGAALVATLIGAFVSYPLLAIARRLGRASPSAGDRIGST